MTDRKLLELAAKAAGIEVTYEHVGVADGYSTKDGVAWNPLTDDGDALRLAVKLRLTVRQDDPDASISGIHALQQGAPTVDGYGPWFCKEWHRDSDPYAATRRAIVRAAAEIGKEMK